LLLISLSWGIFFFVHKRKTKKMLLFPSSVLERFFFLAFVEASGNNRLKCSLLKTSDKVLTKLPPVIVRLTNQPTNQLTNELLKGWSNFDKKKCKLFETSFHFQVCCPTLRLGLKWKLFTFLESFSCCCIEVPKSLEAKTMHFQSTDSQAMEKNEEVTTAAHKNKLDKHEMEI